MNAKTLLLNTVVGLVTGAAVLFFLRGPLSSCCGAPAILILAALVGPALAPLFYGYTLKTGSAIGFGVVHGLLVGIAVVVVCAFGLFAFTSDDTVRKTIDSWYEGYKSAVEEAEKRAPESNREQNQKYLDRLEEISAQLKKDPNTTRSVILGLIAFGALLLGVLGGMLGGWLGSLIFRDRLKLRPEAASDDLLKMPEQPKPWWEKE